jgi:hypothetical protein
LEQCFYPINEPGVDLIFQLTKEASERNPILRAGFGITIGTLYTPEQLVFTDECYVDKRSTARLRGWTPSGERAIVKQPFIRGRRWVALAYRPVQVN